LNDANNTFLNIDSNLNFWSKWYDICESYLDKQKNNEINLIYNDNYNKVINEIRYKYNIDRVMDPNKELIENDIKIWLGFLINNLHKEWEASFLFKNNKEMLYWELLYKLEYIGLEKNER
jgi:hypothetical protein